MGSRAGAVSVVELLLVLGLSAPLFATWAAFVRTLSAASATQQRNVRVQETLRTARMVLQNEVRYALPAQWVAAGGDSLSFRAVRGGGAICSLTGNELTVRYSGVRPPDVSKDSVLLISDTVIEVAPITGATAVAACGGGIAVQLGAPPAATPAFALIFERGTYAISGGALRYRRGAGGRQPLTEGILAPGSGLSSSGTALELTLRPVGAAGSKEDPVRLSIRGLNGAAGVP